MPWGIAAAAVVGAVGANMAAGTQAGAQEQAAATQQQMFSTINSQEQPFMQAGYGATSSLKQLLGLTPGDPGGGLSNGYLTKQFTPQDFQNNLDPGYQWQLQQGQQAIRNTDTPGVGALSGAALKDLIGFNQGMASTGYQNAFNRFTTQQNNIFARLSGIAGLGQNAASNTGTAGTSLGTGIAQAQAAAGGSIASGISGASNNIGQSILLSNFMNPNSGWTPSGPSVGQAGADSGYQAILGNTDLSISPGG